MIDGCASVRGNITMDVRAKHWRNIVGIQGNSNKHVTRVVWGWVYRWNYSLV